MDFARTVFLLGSVLAFAYWTGLVMKASGEDKLTEACHPVEFATDQLIKITTGLTGFTPNWTVKTKQVLQGGCYYFFSTFLFSEGLDSDADAEGGIRQSDPNKPAAVPSNEPTTIK